MSAVIYGKKGGLHIGDAVGASVPMSNLAGNEFQMSYYLHTTLYADTFSFVFANCMCACIHDNVCVRVCSSTRKCLIAAQTS